MAKKKKPVSIAGIEFDALIEQQSSLTATIPSYPVEDGFPVSDTIVPEPLTLQMTLFVTNTPVTWLKQHGNSKNRVRKVCKKLEDLWESRKLVKIVTPDAIYKNMGITGISIKKSAELGYAREVSITAQKVWKTKKKTVKIPNYVLKSGETKATAGTADTSKTSTSVSVAQSDSSAKKNENKSVSGNKKDSEGNVKKSKSILYGIAEGLDFI